MGNVSTGVSGTTYYDWASRGWVFSAYATVTAPPGYTTAAGTGGPLLWNNTGITSARVKAVLLAVGIGVTTASAAAVAIGITGNTGQSAAPGASTAIDANQNLLIGGPAPLCNLYRKGTVSSAGDFFQPVYSLGTGAVTVGTENPAWTELHGLVIVQPGAWASVSPSATATSAVLSIGLVWAEIPF